MPIVAALDDPRIGRATPLARFEKVGGRRLLRTVRVMCHSPQGVHENTALSPSGGSELGLIDEEDDVSDEQSTAKTSAERSVQQGLERARELNEQIMQAARKAGEEFFQRYVSWLEAIANEQQKLASSPHISQMDWLAGMLNSQAEFARKFASTLKDFSGRTTELVQEQVKQAEEAEKERARQARAAERQQAREAQREQEEQEEAEKERARQARAAERQQAREARQAARRRYEGKTKAELSEELSTRELPKTGTVEELIERLVEADTQQ
jgi:hypothetical protein